MKTRKNRPCLLYLLLRISAMVSMKREEKNGTIDDEGIKKETPVYRDCMDMRDREDVVTSYPKEDIIKLS